MLLIAVSLNPDIDNLLLNNPATVFITLIIGFLMGFVKGYIIAGSFGKLKELNDKRVDTINKYHKLLAQGGKGIFSSPLVSEFAEISGTGSAMNFHLMLSLKILIFYHLSLALGFSIINSI
jgi:hypothetical protein